MLGESLLCLVNFVELCGDINNLSVDCLSCLLAVLFDLISLDPDLRLFIKDSYSENSKMLRKALNLLSVLSQHSCEVRLRYDNPHSVFLARSAVSLLLVEFRHKFLLLDLLVSLFVLLTLAEKVIDSWSSTSVRFVSGSWWGGSGVVWPVGSWRSEVSLSLESMLVERMIFVAWNDSSGHLI